MFRATKIGIYLKAMKQRGIGARQLLAGTTINPKLVANPEYLISLDQYQRVVANMMALTNNPGIAFSLGDESNLNELGIVGYAMISAKSLRQALDIWLKYSNSLVGVPINVESFHDVSPGYELVVSSKSSAGVFQRFETEELLAQGMRLVEMLTGIKPVVGKVSFSYPKPAHHALYKEVFKCPFEFSAPQTVYRVLEPELDVPIQTMDEELFRVCAEHCGQVMTSMASTGRLRSQLRSLFLASPGNLPSIASASAALGMSASTLHRQLTTQGQSYQGIKDQFRFDLAKEYLLSGHMAPKQVAHLLGFTSPSTFFRAFKSWSGQTVGQFLEARDV